MTGFPTSALDRKSTRLNSSHTIISYAVFCLKKKKGLRASTVTPLAPVGSGSPGRITHSPRTSALFFFNDPAPPEIYTLSLHAALPINDTATTEIYTLSLHDALPISVVAVS